MSMKNGLVRGALSLGGARIATNLLNAATLLILARLLTPQDFGIVAIASAVLHFVMSLTQVSIFHALVQRSVVTREHIDTAWTIALLRTLLIASFFLLAAWPLSIVYNDPRMIPVFIVTGLTGAVTGLFNPHMNLATKDMRFGPLTVFQICQKGSGLIVAIVLALIFQSFWAIIIGNFVGAALASLLSYFLIPYRPRLTLIHVRDIWGFSGWMFLNQLCETVNWRFDQLAVSVVVPKAQMGLYAMADSLAVIPTRETIQPLREALFPGLAVLSGDPARMGASCMRAQATIAFISMPLGIGLALVAGPAVEVVLGEKWLAIVPFVQIFSVSGAIGAMTSCFQPTAMALGQTRINFLQQFWVMVLRIPLIMVGLLTGGLIGAVLARLVSDIAGGAICTWYMRRLLGISIRKQLASHSTALLGLAVMSLAVWQAEPVVALLSSSALVKLVALSSIGGFAYAAASAAIWLVGGRSHGPVAELFGVVARFMPASSRRAEAGS